MKKGVAVSLVLVAVLFLSLVSVVSANPFGDFWAKITGKSVSGAVCGNLVVEPGEQCESNSVLYSCVGFGFNGGVVACGSDCLIDTTQCSSEDDTSLDQTPSPSDTGTSQSDSTIQTPSDSTESLPTQISSCSDSDEGVNPYVLGTVTGGVDGSVSITDSCILSNEGFGSMSLTEYYCNEESMVVSSDLDCPNGCVDGACVASSDDGLTELGVVEGGTAGLQEGGDFGEDGGEEAGGPQGNCVRAGKQYRETTCNWWCRNAPEIFGGGNEKVQIKVADSDIYSPPSGKPTNCPEGYTCDVNRGCVSNGDSGITNNDPPCSSTCPGQPQSFCAETACAKTGRGDVFFCSWDSVSGRCAAP